MAFLLKVSRSTKTASSPHFPRNVDLFCSQALCVNVYSIHQYIYLHLGFISGCAGVCIEMKVYHWGSFHSNVYLCILRHHITEAWERFDEIINSMHHHRAQLLIQRALRVSWRQYTNKYVSSEAGLSGFCVAG